MSFPNLTDYKNAVANAGARFATVKATPVRDAQGNPAFLAGNFAGVFKMVGADGAPLAVKCFTRKIPHLERRYGAIAAFIKSSGSPHFVPFQFLSGEIYVTSRLVPHGDFPVLTMPWVEARNLGAVVALLCERNKPAALARLGQAWAQLCLDLLDRGVAHGDLKHDNVLVTDQGKLRLIDYDSMYLPALQGLTSSALGSPHFQHPLRNESHFHGELDHVSMLSVLLALRHLIFHPQDYARYHNGENILLRRQDLADPRHSDLLRQMKNSPDMFIKDWALRLESCCVGGDIAVTGLKAALKAALRLDTAVEQPGLKWILYRRMA